MDVDQKVQEWRLRFLGDVCHIYPRRLPCLFVVELQADEVAVAHR